MLGDLFFDGQIVSRFSYRQESAEGGPTQNAADQCDVCLGQGRRCEQVLLGLPREYHPRPVRVLRGSDKGLTRL